MYTCIGLEQLTMKLIISIAIQHAVDLEDVRIGVRSRELVTSTVEAQDELFNHVRGRRRNRSVLHVVVLDAGNGWRCERRMR
jgi:hypothetical protein